MARISGVLKLKLHKLGLLDLAERRI